MSLFLFFIFPMTMIMAALSDLVSLKIPNSLSIILVATFGPLAYLAGLPLEAVLTSFAAGAAILMLGFMLFAMGTLGGGDAKLMAAASVWIGSASLPTFCLYVALIGGILAASILVFRRLPNAMLITGTSSAIRLHQKGRGIPYGIAIAGAEMLTMPKTELYALVAL